MFDRAIRAAEQRVLAFERQRPGAVTIREVMDPAIRAAARRATAWAAVVTGAGVVLALGIARRRDQRPTTNDQRRRTNDQGLRPTTND